MASESPRRSASRSKARSDGQSNRSRSRGRSRTRSRTPSRSRSRKDDRRSRSAGSRDGRDQGNGGGKRFTGTVIRWHDRGFGFVKPDDGKEDVFVHVSSIRDGNALKEGSTVTYDLLFDRHRGKDRADNVEGGIQEDRPPPRRGGYDRRDDNRRGRSRSRDRYGGGGGGYGRPRYDSRERPRYERRSRSRGRRY